MMRNQGSSSSSSFQDTDFSFKENIYQQLVEGNIETIRSFLLTKSRNKYFLIIIHFGDKKGGLRVRRNREIDSFEFEDVIDLTYEQHSFVQFVGLKSLQSGEVLPMIPHPIIPNTTFLEKKYVNRMKEGEEFVLLTQDTREDAVSRLSKDQLEAIRDKFNKIDENRSGVITTHDIEKYFKTICENKIANLTHMVQEKVKKEPHKELYHSQQLEKHIKMVKKQCETNVEYFRSIDLNNDGIITFEEFKVCCKILQSPMNFI